MKKYILIIFIVGITACIDPYIPSVDSSATKLLVVDGFINAGAGPTTFKLSYTSDLIDQSIPVPHVGATVSIQGEDNTTITLAEIEAGTYQHDQVILNPGIKYRLYVRTSQDIEYASEFVSVKDTPPIESVGWDVVSDGAQIYVNTNDPSGQTRFYQWDYEETWHFRSQFCTLLEFRDGAIRPMDPVVDIHNCWRSDDPNGKIIIFSTERLRQDIVYKYPVLKLPHHTEKLQVTYSVLIKQRALTKEAFNHLDLLRKSTESVGSIFDPQPSQVTGNIRNLTDPSEIVLGFVSAADVEEKRLFIQRSQVEDFDQFEVFVSSSCYEDVISPLLDSTAFHNTLVDYYERGIILPTNPIDSIQELQLPEVLGLDTIPFASRRCVDCRIYGTNIKPSYWPPLPDDFAFGCN